MRKGKTCSSCEKEDGKEGETIEVCIMKEGEKKQTWKSTNKRVVEAASG